MKKICAPVLVGLVASVCLVLTGGTVGSAHAVAADPYVGFVATNCRITVDHNSGQRNAPRVLSLVEVPSSKAQPKGVMKIVVRGKGGKVLFNRTLSTQTGSAQKFFLPKSTVARKYRASISFTPTDGSVFLACDRKARFRPSKQLNG